MTAARTWQESHVLVLSPLSRDVSMAKDVLARAGFDVLGFADIDALVDSMQSAGAGMLLVAAEALSSSAIVSRLTSVLHTQPAWSDLPVSIITHSRIADPHELRAVRGLEHLHSVTFLDRPVRIASLVSTVRAALQARHRQYQVRDLLRAAEDAVRQRDEFLAMLSHELRNPLASVSNAVQVMRLQPQRSEQVTEILERQVGLLSRMVDDLLDVGRITSGKVDLRCDRFDLHQPLRDALQTVGPYIESRQHALEVSEYGAALHVKGDSARLAQVFANLLHNAAKYTDPGGRLQVSLGLNDDSAELRVRDSGIGIAPEQGEHVFELFAQASRDIDRSQGGLGIGLTVARRLVEMHGGTISLHSDGIGCGSEFCVRLPLSQTVDETAAAKPRAAARDHACRVLIVDDNREVADGLAMLIETLGHDVRTVYRGSEALNYVRDYRPQVVFLDLGMPGMDGFEVARALRAAPRRDHMQVVALTGYGDTETVQKCHACGFDQHLLKPAKLESIQELLNDGQTAH